MYEELQKAIDRSNQTPAGQEAIRLLKAGGWYHDRTRPAMLELVSLKAEQEGMDLVVGDEVEDAAEVEMALDPEMVPYLTEDVTPEGLKKESANDLIRGILMRIPLEMQDFQTRTLPLTCTRD